MLQEVVRFVCRDTVAILKWLLEEALAGNLLGIAICIRLRDGSEEILFTGAYLARRRNAVCAAGEMFKAAIVLDECHPTPSPDRGCHRAY